ncbi:MAG TPA: Hsp20/alpha crystallin family protein, partial [Chthonomonadales bacterium]|nr:Hsp20/alpha crystallin family protein [Chthonomonadales bacterium]
MKQEEIDVEMADDTLTIRGERRLEEDHPRENYVREERQFGAFQRTFTIGVPIETAQVSAQYRNGVLEVRLPKSEVTKPKKVQVSVA